MNPRFPNPPLTSRRWIGGAQLALASLAMLAATDLASAQSCKRYRGVIISVMPPPSSLNESLRPDNTFGINNKGQVVFAIDGNPSPSVVDPHAALWLPVPDYNFTTAGVKDLHNLSSPAIGHVMSEANDINEAGIAVGFAGANLGQPRAWAWHVNNAPSPGINIPNADIHTASGDFSIAHGINNISPPRVVGFAQLACTNPLDPDLDRGFHIPTLGSSTMQELSPSLAPDSSAYSYALAVNSLSSVTIAGRDDFHFTFSGGSCNPDMEPLNCDDPHKDALRWLQSTGFMDDSLPRPTYTLAIPGGVEGRGTNAFGEVVGTAIEVVIPTIGPMLCFRRAIIWDAQEVWRNLHVTTFLPADHETIAEAISDQNVRGFTRVAGANIFTNRGIVFERNSASPGGGWCVRTLLDNPLSGDDITLSCVWDEVTGTCFTDFFVERAHDVNNHGQIVGYGQRASENFDRVVVLTCRADIHNFKSSSGTGIKADLRVNGADLGELLNHWGPCPGGSCPEDLTDDGVVDGADLGILQLTWSGDNVCSIETPMCVSCGGEGAGAGAFAGGGEDVAGSDAGIAAELEAALFFAGFQSIEAYVAWALEAPPSDVNAIGQFVHDILNAD